jgi:biotin transport system substrate-specific component
MQSNVSSHSALAISLWPQNVNRAVRAVVLVLAGTAVLALSAKTEVPFYPVPMTLQTLAVMALAAAYGSQLAVATVLAYLAEGLIGLPVFANTPPQIAGPAYLIGPTAGFLWGFVVAAAIVGFAADRGNDRSIAKLFVAMVAADIVVFVLGLLWLGAAIPKVGYSAKLLQIGLYPFVLADLLKIVLAALLVPAAWRIFSPKES